MSESRRVYTENRIIGNNALDLSRSYSLPWEEENQQPRQEQMVRPEPRVDANYARINRLCTIVLAFVIMATLGVCVVFLKTQFSYTEINNRIETVKRELNTIKRENIQLEDDIKNMVDLEQVYEVATTRLNMRLPGPGDVFYIENNPVTYTTKYGDVKVEKEQKSIGSVLGYITRGW